MTKPKHIRTLATATPNNAWRLRAVVDAFPRVRTFEDATEPMVLVVRQADIARAVRKDPAHCAFACAAQNSDFDGAYIARTVAYFVKGSRAIRYKPSEKAYAEIRAFDIAGSFEPSAYSFRPMDADKRFGTKASTHAFRGLKPRPKPTEAEVLAAKARKANRGSRPADYVRVFGA